MADEKYSIDDILKEIDTARVGKSKKKTYGESVTDILGERDEIDELINSGKQQKSSSPGVTEIIDSIGSGRQREPVRSARQRTDSEVEARIAEDIAKAAENKRRVIPEPDDDVKEFAAKQRTEDEVNARISKDISNAADMKRWEKLSVSSEQEDDDDIKTYSPETEYEREYVSDESDDSTEIELHDAGSFVPTETMEMRRQKKLSEFQSALLKLDSESENPNDILDSLNPMETREKAAAELNADEDTDTLTVSGNDLKNLARGEEHIKEYTPSVSRRRGRSDEEKSAARQSPFTGELHVGESIIDALNKKINEQSSDLPSSEELNIAPPNTADDTDETDFEGYDEVKRIKQANELAKKKKRKLADFIIESQGDTGETDKMPEKPDNAEAEHEVEEEDDETPVDINDEEVIRERLHRASKGLWGRFAILLVLLAASIFVGAVYLFKLKIGRLANMINNPETYLYIHLGIGIFSFIASSSVLSNGFARLFKLRPDGDTLCALAHTGALVAAIPHLASSDYIQRGFSHIYLAMSLCALIFNTLSKLFTVKAAQKNFDFVFGSKSKYFIERCEGSGSDQLAKGAVEGIPFIASIRKTEMLCDFIVSAYSEDSSDRTSRRIVPIAIVAAIAGGVIAFFTCSSNISGNKQSWVATVSTAILAVSASFSSSMTVTLPMYLMSRKSEERGCAILGYGAAEEMSETNAVLANAKMLFPADSIKIVNICGYDTPKTRGEGKINIDEAIIYAASLAMASDSVLSDALFHILNYKKELLKNVSGCVYENNLGVMGWIDRRRVLLGTREHMKAHEITVPNTKKEAAANKNKDEVIYLAVGGEVCLLFFVRPTADPEIRRAVRELAFRDISIVVKTVDGMITAPVIARVFGIDEENVKVLPFEMHDTFDENTKFVSEGSAAVTCDGSFSSMSNSIVAARTIRDRAAIGNVMQFIGVIIAIIALLIFALVCDNDQLKKFNLFNVFWLMIYNTVWGVLTLGVQSFRRM